MGFHIASFLLAKNVTSTFANFLSDIKWVKSVEGICSDAHMLMPAF